MSDKPADPNRLLRAKITNQLTELIKHVAIKHGVLVDDEKSDAKEKTK